MLNDTTCPDSIETRVEVENINPQPRSGQQVLLENFVNKYV